MSLLFADPGGSATVGTQLWSSISGSVAVDNAASPAPPSGSNGYSIKCDTTASPATAFVARTGLLGSAGRVSAYVDFVNLSGTNSVQSLRILDSANGFLAGVTYNQDGTVSLTNGDGNSAPVVWATSAASYNLNEWHRWGLCWTWTSQSVNEWRLYIDGTLVGSASNKTLLSANAPNNLRLGWGGAVPGASRVMRVAHVVVDSDSSLADLGDARATAKQYTGTNENTTNNAFDTNVGTAVATIGSRYLALSERPSSDSNGRQQAATTQKAESFTLQDAATGDADLTGTTILGWLAWVRTKTAASANLTLTDNSVDSTIANTTTITTFLHLTTSSSYPTAGRFGVKSTGTTTDSFVYEGGAVVAYTVPTTTNGSGAVTLGALTGSAAGSVALTGSAATALAALTGSASGTVDLTGQGAAALAPVTGSGAGAVALTGSGAAPFNGVLGAATGGVALTGQGAALVDPLTGTAAGGVALQAQGAATLDALTSTAAGVVGASPITGAGAATLAALGSSGTGALALAGQGAAGLADVTGSAAGAVVLTADGVGILAALTGAAAGVLAIQAAGSGALADLTGAATGTPGGVPHFGHLRVTDAPRGGVRLPPSRATVTLTDGPVSTLRVEDAA